MELFAHQLGVCVNVVFSGVHYYCCFECTRNYLLLISGGLEYTSLPYHVNIIILTASHLFSMKRKARQTENSMLSLRSLANELTMLRTR